MFPLEQVILQPKELVLCYNNSHAPRLPNHCILIDGKCYHVGNIVLMKSVVQYNKVRFDVFQL